MSGTETGDLQHLFARLLAEPELAQQLHQPERFAQKHGYAVEAVKALASVASGQLSVAANDTAQKRRKRMQDLIPRTFTVMPANDYWGTYIASHPPHHHPNRAGTLLDAASFAAFLQARSEPVSRAIGELAAYEVMLREADAAAITPVPEGSTFPSVAPGVKLGSFPYRVDLAYERAATGEVNLGPSEPMPSHFVVRSVGKAIVNIHHVHGAVVAVLRCCLGELDIHGISQLCGVPAERVRQVLLWAKNKQLVCWKESS